MRTAFWVMLLLASAAAGCTSGTSRAPARPSTSCVYLDSGLENEVTVVQVVEEKKGDLLSSQIMLYNNLRRPVTVLVRARYFDAAGREVRSTFGQWTPLPLDRNASRSFSATAPVPSVTRIQFELKRPANETARPRPRAR